MAGLGQFAAGFLQSFTQAKNRKRDKEEEETEKKARLKLFEVQMERAAREGKLQEQAKLERDQFFQSAKERMIGGKAMPGTGVVLGDVDTKPQSLSEMLADPEMAMKALQSGVMSPEQLLPKPKELPNSIQEGLYLQQNPDLAQFLLDQKTKVAAAGAASTNVRVDLPGDHGLTPPPEGMYRPDPTQPGVLPEPGVRTPAQQAVDSEFAKEYTAYVALGGAADVQKQIAQLEAASVELQKAVDGKGPSLTGAWTGNTPDLIRQVNSPKSIAVRDNVEEVIQRNLRLILGAQFTEKEGERLISRAYNERLGEAENKDRIDRLGLQMKAAAKAKQDAAEYYESNGTLAGFKGKLPTISDFAPEANEPEGIPLGSIKIGTSGGNDVWQTPDGKKLIVED